MMLSLLTLIEEPQYQINIWKQIIESRGVVLGVLIVLIGMSVFCWFIIGFKYFYFRKVRRETGEFLNTFWKSESLDDIFKKAELLPSSSVAGVFTSAYSELVKVKGGERNPSSDKKISNSAGFENIERAIRRAHSSEISRLEKFNSFLATTGSSAPFIGLFGTVWGIMKAFAYIHPDRPILETVTPHIAQALIATAIGLFAAIPAVMAYNYFSSRIKEFNVGIENFSIDFLNILKRHFFKD